MLYFINTIKDFNGFHVNILKTLAQSSFFLFFFLSEKKNVMLFGESCWNLSWECELETKVETPALPFEQIFLLTGNPSTSSWPHYHKSALTHRTVHRAMHCTGGCYCCRGSSYCCYGCSNSNGSSPHRNPRNANSNVLSGCFKSYTGQDCYSRHEMFFPY